MKKTTLSMAIAMLFALASCQKENSSKQSAAVTPEKVIKQKVNVASPAYYYVDLVLQPRQPGENFDSYLATYGTVPVKVTGSPSWNSTEYPLLANGVPTAGASLSAVPGHNAYVTNGTSGNIDIFTVTVGVLGSSGTNTFLKDVNDYNSAFSAFIASPLSKPVPLTDDYIKPTYSTTANIINTTGKLIRVTTGSHWAIASINYPVPNSTSTTSETLGGVTDPNDSSLYYVLDGARGRILSCRTPGITVTGTYTHAPGTTVYHYIGKITRADGTSFTFDEIMDIA